MHAARNIEPVALRSASARHFSDKIIQLYILENIVRIFCYCKLHKELLFSPLGSLTCICFLDLDILYFSRR